MPDGLWVSLEKLTEQIVLKAIRDGLFEGQSLDFKRRGYGDSESEKKELLRDVVAMTNGGGGMILIGIDKDPQEEGKAGSITPVQNGDAEAERAYTTSLSGIEDLIPGIAIHPIPVSGGFVIALRCPRSFRGPHMVSFKGENRFWIRHRRTKQRMTFREIRDAFGQSKTFETNIRLLVEKRRSKLRSGKGRVFLHVAVAPYGPLDDVLDINDQAVRVLLQDPPMIDHYHRGTTEVRPTLSGLLARGVWGKTNTWEIELSRNGAVGLSALLPRYTEEANKVGVWVVIESLVEYAISLARLASALFSHVGLTGPFVLFLDLFVNTEREQFAKLHASLQKHFRAIQPKAILETSEVLVPETVVHNLDQPDRVFRGMLDKLWNSFGEDRCPYFDRNGDPNFGG